MSRELTITADEAAKMTCLRPTAIIDPATGRMYEGLMPMCGVPASYVIVPYGMAEGAFAVKDMTAWCSQHVKEHGNAVQWTPISKFVR